VTIDVDRAAGMQLKLNCQVQKGCPLWTSGYAIVQISVILSFVRIMVQFLAEPDLSSITQSIVDMTGICIILMTGLSNDFLKKSLRGIQIDPILVQDPES